MPKEEERRGRPPKTTLLEKNNKILVFESIKDAIKHIADEDGGDYESIRTRFYYAYKHKIKCRGYQILVEGGKHS